MPSRPIDDTILRSCRALDQLYGDRIERVVLFGSRARGDAREEIRLRLRGVPVGLRRPLKTGMGVGGASNDAHRGCVERSHGIADGRSKWVHNFLASPWRVVFPRWRHLWDEVEPLDAWP